MLPNILSSVFWALVFFSPYFHAEIIFVQLFVVCTKWNNRHNTQMLFNRLHWTYSSLKQFRWYCLIRLFVVPRKDYMSFHFRKISGKILRLLTSMRFVLFEKKQDWEDSHFTKFICETIAFESGKNAQKKNPTKIVSQILLIKRRRSFCISFFLNIFFSVL